MADPNEFGGPGGPGRITRDVEDAVTYPILTEQVSFPRSGGGPTTGAISSPGGAGLGQTAALAIGDVLGWKVSGTDPKGFVGALTQAFTLTDVEGHVESSWNPRTYAVQTDLGGGITGAQASLYTRAKDALDQSLSLLDGLYPLDPDADPEYVKALREMARSQMTEIVKEFGAVGLPSILRIDTYFEILLGQRPVDSSSVQFNPDQIRGTLGQLRDTYGIYFRGNPFNNSIEDEQDITNFRVISDYMTSLMQSWLANREFFIVAPNRVAFFGTQLVLISRQLNVIAETVEEVRFVLDSVFIGPNERKTLLLRFTDRRFPPMFLEDVLIEIERFVKDEGPRLLRDGGKISVTNNILPVVRTLRDMIIEAHDPENRRELPDGFRTARVRHSLDDLRDQLNELINLTEQVEQQVPFPEGELRITGISAAQWNIRTGEFRFSVFGYAIDRAVEVHYHSDAWTKVTSIDFYSAERIDVKIDNPIPGPHDIRVTNPDGAFAIYRFHVAPPAPSAVVAIATPSANHFPTVDAPFNLPIQAEGWNPPFVLTTPNCDLAPGLTISDTGISGKPTAPGTYSSTVQVKDAKGYTATAQLNFVVAAPVSIATMKLPYATADSFYSQNLLATGGTAPITWNWSPLTGSSLPPGLALSSAGVVSGMPTTPGRYEFSVTATDANLSSDAMPLAIEVHQAVNHLVEQLYEKVDNMEKAIFQLIEARPEVRRRPRDKS